METVTNAYVYGKGIVEVLVNYVFGVGTNVVDLAQNLYIAIVR